MKQGFRLEIQALRAFAVLAVVVFHLWPERLTGGYVGVDVFFVISGYLITAHLTRELSETGGVKLGRFYARRIRRLLPAAFLVLLVTLAGILLLVPRGEWAVMLRDAFAAAVYALNWVLAGSSVDYFAAEHAASPVQHYWSLSVEEQFYIVWPLLLLLAFRLKARRGLLVMMGLVGVASLIYSVVGANAFQEFAYFATPAHAWEFAIGGVVALVLPRITVPDGPWSAAASWAGWLALAASVALFDADSPFPGWIALLPVAGTVLVIAAGMPASRWSPAAIMRWRPIRFTGDISYSLYLWHWPPIVLLPFALESWVGRDYLTALEKVLLLGACVLLAWLTKILVEDPVRTAAFLRTSSRTFLAGAAATVLVVAVAVTPSAVLAQQRATENARLDAAIEVADPCFGANAALSTGDCADSHLLADLDSVPFLSDDNEFAWAERRAEDDPFFTAECTRNDDGVQQCRHGDADAPYTLAVVGDSHAGHLLPAVLTVAEARGWSVDVWRLTECTPALRGYFAPDPPDSRPECESWRDGVFDAVAASDADLVVTTSFTARYTRYMRESPKRVAALEDGLLAGWDVWRESGKSVLAVSDTPSWKQNVPRCVADAVDDPDDACGSPRSSVVFPDPMLGAVERADDPAIAGLDLTDVFCDDTVCHPVVGGLVVARDSTHLTASFASTLAARFDDALAGLAAR